MRTLLGRYPNTLAIHAGAVRPAGLALDIADVEVPNRAFKRVVRDLEFDVAELALMTYLMARSRGAPLCLLPVVLFARNPLPLVARRTRDTDVTPTSLGARRIGVRSYTTTTAVWVRRLLVDEFGSNVADARWLTLDEGHVADVPDPPGVERFTGRGDVGRWLVDGTVDVAIVDPVPVTPAVTQLLPDSEAPWRSWQRRTGATTVNHVVVVRESLVADSAAMRTLFEMFREARRLGADGVDSEATPFGFEANRRNLEVALETATAERLLARPLTIGDLVPPPLQLS